MNPLPHFKKALPLLVITLLACFALPPRVQAVDPPPDGGYANWNTAEGDGALFSVKDGSYDTAIGSVALWSNTTGEFNTAIGANALVNNETGDKNTATGGSALLNNDGGSFNTATGAVALSFNTTASFNTANGAYALSGNETGYYNTAIGAAALGYSNATYYNTAIGAYALYNNAVAYVKQTAFFNTASGAYALFSNTTGYTNTANGAYALFSNTTGSNNIAIGFASGFGLTTGSNNIDIGSAGIAAEANTIRIGTLGKQSNAYVAGISGATVPTGVAVIVDSSGHLGTTTSSARFKESIKPMDKASEAILALKPVTFRYKHDLDPDGIPQFGLVAEDVEKVNPDLVARDEQGKPYTVRYEAVNAMLLNEFLKEHRTVQELKSEIADLTATVKEQAAKIQKVTAQLELSKAAPQKSVSSR